MPDKLEVSDRITFKISGNEEKNKNKKIKCELLAHVRSRCRFSSILCCEPHSRNLHIRSLTAGSSWFDCVFCYKGERRKKNEIDRLHYILVDAEVWFSKQTKHLGQVYKSVVAIYDHSTRISFFFFPLFFSFFFTFNSGAS